MKARSRAAARKVVVRRSKVGPVVPLAREDRAAMDAGADAAGGGRMAPRDRRMQGRGRRRDQPPPRAPYGGGGSHAPSHGGGAPRPEVEEHRRHSELPPEQRTWILEAKAEVERIQEVLEGVLGDLDQVAEQLTKAEHEKDIAEAEIEQLRESLRRLHR